MKHLPTILIAVVVGFMTAYVTVQSFAPNGAATAQKESVYDRVIRTGTIRCGYFSWYPGFIKDVKTGELKGIFYEYAEQLAHNLGLKVEWTEEIPLGDVPVALAADRIDVFCTPQWVTATRARGSDFIMPVFYLPLYGFSREGDSRFDNDLMLLNDKRYTMAILEGGATANVRNEIFPDSTPLELPQLTSPAELFTTLASGKADAVIYDMFTYGEYNKNNPGKVRLVSDKAIKVFPNVMAIKHGEGELREMLSNATLEMHLSGAIDKIITKHELYPNAIYRYQPTYGTGE